MNFTILFILQIINSFSAQDKIVVFEDSADRKEIQKAVI
jgi:hypothetical protein